MTKTNTKMQQIKEKNQEKNNEHKTVNPFVNLLACNRIEILTPSLI